MCNENNYFLNSELAVNEKNREKAKFHVLPVPLEKTISYGKGTSMGPQAIINASNELERYTGKSIPCAHGIFTYPLLDCSKSIKNILIDIENITKDISLQNKIPVTLGGEHSITYAAVNGVFKGLGLSNKNEIGIIQIDAHADLRERYQNQVHSHASVMYLLGNEKYRIAQFGVRAISEEEVKNRTKFNIIFLDAQDIYNKKKFKLPSNFPENIYITFDVDGLDPSIMPATGTPVPGGLGYYESLYLIKDLIKGRKVIGLDVVEFSPIKGFIAYDFTVATLVYKIMELINLNN